MKDSGERRRQESVPALLPSARGLAKRTNDSQKGRASEIAHPIGCIVHLSPSVRMLTVFYGGSRPVPHEVGKVLVANAQPLLDEVGPPPGKQTTS